MTITIMVFDIFGRLLSLVAWVCLEALFYLDTCYISNWLEEEGWMERAQARECGLTTSQMTAVGLVLVPSWSVKERSEMADFQSFFPSLTHGDTISLLLENHSFSVWVVDLQNFFLWVN